jgi:ribonuclease VapC
LIIDSSALIAIITSEPGKQKLLEALTQSRAVAIPAPVLTETQLVAGGRGAAFADGAQKLVAKLIANGASIIAFDHHHAAITMAARKTYGKGNGTGGKLNFGDLMVYAIAKATGLPVLCTGNDFVETDLVLHPASRIDP